MAQIIYDGTEYEVADVEAFNKKQGEGGEKGDHVTKFTMESDFGEDFIDAVTTPEDNEFVLKAAGLEITVYPYDSSLVVQDTLNQMTGEEVTNLQIALITEASGVYYQ